MILDKRSEFSDAQAVTASAISTEVIDLSASPTLHAIGVSPVYLIIYVDTAATAAGAATVTFSLESDSTADLATSATVHWTSAAIGKATLVAGYQVALIPVPADKRFERYLGVRYTVATGPLTAGAFSASLVTSPAVWSAYPDQHPAGS